MFDPEDDPDDVPLFDDIERIRTEEFAISRESIRGRYDAAHDRFLDWTRTHTSLYTHQLEHRRHIIMDLILAIEDALSAGLFRWDDLLEDYMTSDEFLCVLYRMLDDEPPPDGPMQSLVPPGFAFL